MNNESNNRIGIIKEIDNLGRLVIPKEFRERLGFDKQVELVINEEGILIRNSVYKLVRTEKPNVQETKKHPLE